MTACMCRLYGGLRRGRSSWPRALLLAALLVAGLAGLSLPATGRGAPNPAATPTPTLSFADAAPSVSPTAQASAASTASPTPTASPSPSDAPGSVLELQPDAGAPQSTTTLSGSHFPPGFPLTIAYGDAQNLSQPLAHLIVAPDGQLPPTRITIPPSAAPGGLGLVTVYQDAQNPTPALGSAPYAVTPLASGLFALPDVATGGGIVELDGVGFQSNIGVRFALIDAAGVQTPLPASGGAPGGQSFDAGAPGANGAIQTSDTGSIGPLSATIPMTAAPGLAVLNAIDAAGDVAGTPLTILPAGAGSAPSQLLLRPSRAALGTDVTVEGTDFAPGEQVVLTLPPPFLADGSSASPAGGRAPLATAIADGDGRVRCHFVLPYLPGVTIAAAGPGDSAAGNGTQAPFGGNTPATGTGGNVGTMVSVALRGTASGIVRSMPLLVAGTTIQTFPAATLSAHPYVLVGNGFSAGEQVRVTQTDDAGSVVMLGPYQTSANGSFIAFAVAPALEPPGSHRSSASDAPSVFSLQAGGQTSGLSARTRLVVSDAPAVTLGQAVVAPGQPAQVRGNAFARTARVTIHADFPTGAAGHGATIPSTAETTTDASGVFAAQMGVPKGAATGPVSIQVQDTAGNQASAVLTVNGQGQIVHVLQHAARPGQVLTVQGSGYASGEAVDIFLAQPASGPFAPGVKAPLQQLAHSTLTVSADQLGAFTAAYPLPQPFAAAAYLVVAVGESSGRETSDYVNVTDPGGATPVPSPPSTTCPPAQAPRATGCPPSPRPTSTPRPSPEPPTDTGTILYFADGSTGSFPRPSQSPTPGCVSSKGTQGRSGCGTSTVSVRAELQLYNTGQQPARVTIAYFFYGARDAGATGAGPVRSRAPQLVRSRVLLLAPRSTGQRSVNADIGDGQLVSIVVRADGPVKATLIRTRSRSAGAQSSAARAGKAAPQATPRPLDGGSEQASEPSTSWYFAEGTIDGIGAQGDGAWAEYLHLLNPDTTATTVRLRLLSSGAAPRQTETLSIGGGERLDLDLRQVLETICGSGPPACVPCKSVAAHGAQGCAPAAGPSRRGVAARVWTCACGLQLSSGVPILAERASYWGEGAGTSKAGFASGPGIARPVTALALAYASRRGNDQAFLTVVDPGSKSARVTLRVYTASGIQVGQRQIPVAAGGRTTTPLDRLVGAGSYSIALDATAPIVAELALYQGSPAAGAGGLLLPATSPARSMSTVGWGTPGAGTPLLRIFNPGVGGLVLTLTPATPSGSGTALRYGLGRHATLLLGLPQGGNRGTVPLGAQVLCSDRCAGVGLQSGGESYGEALR